MTNEEELVLILQAKEDWLNRRGAVSISVRGRTTTFTSIQALNEAEADCRRRMAAATRPAFGQCHGVAQRQR